MIEIAIDDGREVEGRFVYVRGSAAYVVGPHGATATAITL